MHGPIPSPLPSPGLEAEAGIHISLSEKDNQEPPPIWLVPRILHLSADQHLPGLPPNPGCGLLLLRELQVGLPQAGLPHNLYQLILLNLNIYNCLIEIGDSEAQTGATHFTRGRGAEPRPGTHHLRSADTFSSPSPVWSCPTELSLVSI